MPVPFIVLRILDEIDRAGLFVEVDHHGVHVTPKDQIPPGLREELWIDRDDLRFYLGAVKRIREIEDLEVAHRAARGRWPRCWWKERCFWEAEKARDADRGLAQERRP